MAKNPVNKLSVDVRTTTGKGASRRARREGRVPVVLYGHGSDPQHLELNAHDFAAVLRKSGTNAVLTLDIEGTEQLALTKAIEVHPIRRNIQHLHERILGEKLDINDPEIERTYQLFVKTWRELHAAANTDLPYECEGRWDRETGAALMGAQIQVTDDRYFTVRSWMAVLSYLMLDYKFLEE